MKHPSKQGITVALCLKITNARRKSLTRPGSSFELFTKDFEAGRENNQANREDGVERDTSIPESGGVDRFHRGLLLHFSLQLRRRRSRVCRAHGGRLGRRKLHLHDRLHLDRSRDGYRRSGIDFGNLFFDRLKSSNHLLLDEEKDVKVRNVVAIKINYIEI